MHRHHDFASFEGRGHRGHFGRRGRRYGHFAAGFLGGPGMRVAKMLASGDLQLIILALLSEKPRHGYEIIKQVEEHSSGAYTPSPGMVYPALTYLEEMGYAASESEGTKKLYRITETGTAYLNENRASVEDTLDQLARFGERNGRQVFTRQDDIQRPDEIAGGVGQSAVEVEDDCRRASGHCSDG